MKVTGDDWEMWLGNQPSPRGRTNYAISFAQFCVKRALAKHDPDAEAKRLYEIMRKRANAEYGNWGGWDNDVSAPTKAGFRALAEEWKKRG